MSKAERENVVIEIGAVPPPPGWRTREKEEERERTSIQQSIQPSIHPDIQPAAASLRFAALARPK